MSQLLPLVREVAERAGLEVRKERGEVGSAVCRIKGALVVVLHPSEPPARECALLLEALAQMDLSGVFVPPAVREALEKSQKISS